MGGKVNKSEIFKKIYKIEKEIESCEYKISSIDGIDDYYYYGHKCGITKFLYKLDGKEWSSYNRNQSFDLLCKTKTDKYNKDPARKRDSSGKLIAEMKTWNMGSQLRLKMRNMSKPYQEMIKELKKNRGRLTSRWNAAKGRKNKSLMGKSIADKVLAGDTDNVEDLYYCTKTGREVKVSFKMILKEKTGDNYWNIKYNREKPETFFDVGMLKIKGFMFDSHFAKSEHGGRRVGYANPKTKMGVLYAANKAGASTDVVNAARKLRNSMTDSIFCHYLGSKAVSSFKIRDIYILNAPKKVNKQEYRGKFRGKDQLYKKRIHNKRKERLTNEIKSV